VATFSTGITVTWNSITFQEIFALSWSYGGERQDRGSGAAAGWIANPGSVTIGCFGSSGVQTSNVGKLGSLSITGGGVNASGNAVLESVNLEPELNGVTRYTVTLKVVT